LSRPDAQDNDTQFYCGWITHPTTDQKAIALDRLDTQPIHADAEPAIDALTQGLAPFLPANELTALQSALMDARGGRINIVDILPTTFTDSLLTRDQAEFAGWFPKDDLFTMLSAAGSTYQGRMLSIPQFHREYPIKQEEI